MNKNLKTEYKVLPFVTIKAVQNNDETWTLYFEKFDETLLRSTYNRLYEDEYTSYSYHGWAAYIDNQIYIPGGLEKDRKIIVNDKSWVIIKNDFKTYGLYETIKTPWFDLEAYKTSTDYYKVTITNLKESKPYPKDLGRRGLVHYSYSPGLTRHIFRYCPQSLSKLFVSCLDRAFILSKEEWDFLKNDKESYAHVKKDRYWFGFDETLSCKEVALNRLSTKENNDREVVITGDFASDFLDKINQWQKNIPNPALITQGDNHIRVQLNDWWYQHFHYRVGWLLLIIRIVQGRETCSNNLTKQITKFCNGLFNTPEDIELSSTRNWRYYFN